MPVRTRIAVVAGGAAVVVFGFGGLALAGTGPSTGASTPGHYSYTDPIWGPVSCNEVHHPSDVLPTGLPAGAVTTGGWDTVTCHVADPNPVYAGQVGTAGWISDFMQASPDPLPAGVDVNQGDIQYSFNGPGTVYSGIAWYPND